MTDYFTRFLGVSACLQILCDPIIIVEAEVRDATGNISHKVKDVCHLSPTLGMESQMKGVGRTHLGSRVPKSPSNAMKMTKVVTIEISFRRRDPVSKTME